MFLVNEADAAAIRAIFDGQGGVVSRDRVAPIIPRNHRQRESTAICPYDRRLEATAAA
jgi:hypothetical protein